MIVHARDGQRNALSDEQVLAHLDILLVAGPETTTTLSAWVLYLLAPPPGYRERVRAELDALLDDADGTMSIEALRAAKELDNRLTVSGKGAWGPRSRRAVGGGQYTITNAAGVVTARGAWHVRGSLAPYPALDTAQEAG